MKKIAIISGKGGVGKSMLASSLAILFSQDKHKIVAVDCDVDAPNLAVWLNEIGNWDEKRKISVSEKPLIDNNKINSAQAQKCVPKCKFKALIVENEKLKLNYFLCEGCGACEFFCPQGAIKMKAVKNGEIKIKNTKYNFPLVSGHLFPGETGSGKVVSEIKQQAEKFKKIIDKINPDEIQLNLPIRPSGVKLSLPSRKTIEMVSKILGKNAKAVVKFSIKKKGGKAYGNLKKDIFNFLKVRPATLEDLTSSLNANSTEIVKQLYWFLERKKIKESRSKGTKYFVIND